MSDLDLFVQGVAHELKQPLSMMVTSADLIVHHYSVLPSEELGAIAADIVRMGVKMGQMIDVFRLLSSMSYPEVDLKPLDMAEVIAAAQESLADVIMAGEAEIMLPPDWPASLGYTPLG